MDVKAISSHFRRRDVALLKGAKWLKYPLRGTDPHHFRPADVWIGWQTCLARVGEISSSMTTFNARRGKMAVSYRGMSLVTPNQWGGGKIEVF
ncbi:hypothetical protein BLNAU_6175 [Blattamonas nauphoetae]|uniref:Uncharacterized protein n=1 Tax=Blattamonas nauphoetae TaxID=2049346 RepID=A0ABQ9Y5A7_9EUKA|nr:hypothetical protein BLNAU_6175 [Blattamonas nauphoetae]